MNEQLETVLELPIQAKLGILAGFVVAIASGYYFLYHTPVREEIVKIETEISTVQLEIAEREGMVANLPRFEKEVEKLEIELKKALSELPDKSEIDQLLARVSDKARDAGLEIRLFKPRGEEKKEFYAEVPVEVEVYGGFHQVATFFDEVGHLERIVNLGQLVMKEPEITEERVTLKTNVVATAFRFLDEKERPSVEEKKDGKRRR